MNRILCFAAFLTCSAAWVAEDLQAAEKADTQGTSMAMVLRRRYLNVPVNNRAPGRSMSLSVDGELLGSFSVPLAEDQPDWWAFFDLARFQGRKLIINITPAPKDWKIVSQDDVIRGAEDLYKEKYRPQFHFTTRRGWINDPNGLVYYQGEYHMYYQHNPTGLPWGNSNDRGRTLTDYQGNPVLTHPGARIDTPRPFWYEPTGRWIAPTYDHFRDEQGKNLRAVGFYSSKDLKQWKFESRVQQDKWGDELCGCADFFQLPLDGGEVQASFLRVHELESAWE